MKKVLVPVAMGIVGFVAFARTTGEQHACCSQHHHESQVEYGNNNRYMWKCPQHGWYDLRFGCPQCKAPKFGF